MVKSVKKVFKKEFSDVGLVFGIKINDFVWMYLKEIGCVDLLMVDEEVVLVF